MYTFVDKQSTIRCTKFSTPPIKLVHMLSYVIPYSDVCAADISNLQLSPGIPVLSAERTPDGNFQLQSPARTPSLLVQRTLSAV